jgi:CHAD domain-containing protein
MVTKHRETERKYEADSGALPSLAGLPQVADQAGPEEETLEAEYYDTEDLLLIRAGITLRRRRGGADEGWHLKLPAGRDSRREIRSPLGPPDRAVPEELADLVRAWIRGQALQPAAHITTTRRRRVLLDEAGNSLAEVVADDVSAQTLGRSTTISRWHEAEIELTGGDHSLLKAAGKLLRHAGLRPADHAAKLERAFAGQLPSAGLQDRPAGTSGDVVLGYIRAQSGALKSLDPLVRRGEPDSVHRMRVASRRLRAALQSFGKVLDAHSTTHLRSELRWLGTELGEVRDGEVLVERLRSRLRQTPAELVMGPVVARVQAHFAPRQAAGRQALLEALDSERYMELLASLDRLLEDPPLTAAAGRPASAELPAAVARAYRRERRRMRRALRAPAGPAREKALHDARKAAKRARYAAEALRPVSGKRARRFAKQQKKLQSVLGDHQDAVMARGTTRDLGVRAFRGGENAFSFGLLHERESSEARELQDRARRTWKHASAARYRRWLR